MDTPHDPPDPSGAVSSPRRTRHNLPSGLTPFLGRESERGTLLAHLRDPVCRLVTLTGIGGVGKTRLAIELAAALAPGGDRATPFPDGVYVVSLASLTPADFRNDTFAITVAGALGMVLSGPDSATRQVGNFLREKALLLVFDNFEHLLAEAARLAELLQAAPALKLLVTSRERLNLRGEWVFELDGLAYPAHDHDPAAIAPEQFSAIQLFILTARAHAPALPITVETVLAIARICRLVDGLPLGIELAASWTRALSCAEIADEIAHSIDFLAGGAVDLPPRQQSMRAIFDSSWGMLTLAERRALRQLAIFPGSFTRDAVVAVAGITLPLLAGLIDKSLVRRVSVGEHAATRYALPEPLRQYAIDELARADENSATSAQHATYYLGLLAEHTASLRGPGQPVALAALSLEIDQIRVAWRYASATGDVPAIERALDGLFHLYDMRSWFGEGADALCTARLALGASPDPGAQLLAGRLMAREGWFVFHGGRQREAQAMLQRSVAIFRAAEAPADLVWALNYLAAVGSYLGEYAASADLARESLALTQGQGDTYGRVIALSVLCQIAYEQADFVAARAWGEQSLALEQQIGSPWSTAFSLLNLGKVVAALGDHPTARDLFERSLRIRQDLGDLRGVAICLNRLGDSAIALGDPAAAGVRYMAALELFREIGNRWGLAATLLNLGRLALEHAPDAAAARLLHEALELALDIGSVPQITAIIATFARLIARAGQAAWAAELERLLDTASPSLDGYQIHAARLLAWSAAAAPAALDVEQALAATLAAAAAPAPADTLRVSSMFPAGLTAREVEVLRLVAEGLTDAQVADQLVLSRRTVHAHLSSIYGKLQVNTRSAATRFALEHGLA